MYCFWQCIFLQIQYHFGGLLQNEEHSQENVCSSQPFPLSCSITSIAAFFQWRAVFEWIIERREERGKKKTQQKWYQKEEQNWLSGSDWINETRKAARALQIKAKLKIKDKLHQGVKQSSTNYENSVEKLRERLYFVQREDYPVHDLPLMQQLQCSKKS